MINDGKQSKADCKLFSENIKRSNYSIFLQVTW